MLQHECNVMLYHAAKELHSWLNGLRCLSTAMVESRASLSPRHHRNAETLKALVIVKKDGKIPYLSAQANDVGKPILYSSYMAGCILHTE